MSIKDEVFKHMKADKHNWADATDEQIIDLTLAKVRNLIEFVDIELLVTDIKDKEGVTHDLSDDVMEIIRIWWEGKSKELLKEISQKEKGDEK